MDLLELEENLQIVFDKEENDLKKDGYTYSHRGTQAKEITYPNSEILMELFSGLGNDVLKSFFIDVLRKRIVNADEVSYGILRPVGISVLCFHVLIELGYTNDAVESLKSRRKTWRGIYFLLYQIIDRNYFDSNQLKDISKKLQSEEKDFLDILPYQGTHLKSKIIQARFEILKTKIRKVNVEINQDKKSVAEKISLLGLSGNYNELLSCIDNFIFTDTSEVVNAGMISNLRTFIADLFKDIAKRIANIEHEEIPKIEGKAEMGNIRGYLKTKLELSDTDNKFIDSFIDVLHQKGGHSFMSEKEYFRLSRNIAIEIALFVLSRYEKKYKK